MTDDTGAPVGFPGKVKITDYHGPAPHQDVDRENEFDAQVVIPELQEDLKRLREALAGLVAANSMGHGKRSESEHVRQKVKREAVRQALAEARAALAPSPDDRGGERCERLLVGQGDDTFDPLCQLARGHSGKCEPKDPDGDWRDPFALLRRVQGYYPEPPSRGLMADVEMCLRETS